jgi:hypothetical protein
MQRIYRRKQNFLAHHFTGDIEALQKDFPKETFTLVTKPSHQGTVVHIFLAETNSRVYPGDWVVRDYEGSASVKLLTLNDFSSYYYEDSDPRYIYRGNLRIYHNDNDWCVADSPEAATKLSLDSLGGTTADFDEFVWQELPAGQQLTITDELLGPCTQLCCAWAEQGAAYLGSVDY